MTVAAKTEHAIREGRNMKCQNTQVKAFCNADGNPVLCIVILHDTEIVRITRRPHDPEREDEGDTTYDVILNTGGWRTATKKARMNAALAAFQPPATPCGVYQQDGKWYLTLPDRTEHIHMKDDVTKFTITMPIPYEGKFVAGA